MSAQERSIKNVAEFRKELLSIKEKWDNPSLAFRGQECKEWLLESSAERRITLSQQNQDGITDELFIEYHRDTLLNPAKLRNYDRREGKRLDELELLADLQHHGAATCLIDFTRNALVALWFACKESSQDGNVFVINTADEQTFSEITRSDIEGKSLKDILKFKTRDDEDSRQGSNLEGFSQLTPKFWFWNPAHLNERIAAQDSLFIFALPSSGKPKSEAINVDSRKKVKLGKN